jgi:hypothetical protein
MDVLDLVVDHVLVSESSRRYDAINANIDGAGISVGLIQWSQVGGGLTELLEHWNYYLRERALEHFGAAWDQVRTIARAKSKAPVGGAQLWEEPWLSRFRAALRDPELQRAQRTLIAQGQYMQGAKEAAIVLGTQSIRALALFLDRAVQQGQGRVLSVARELAEDAVRLADDEPELLARFADAMVERFRLAAGPPPASTSSRLQWKAVDGEWHLFSGAMNLYTSSRRRVDAILADPKLSDAPSTAVAGTLPALTLGPGASGPHVMRLQAAMNVLHGAGLAVDGRFGPLTKAAFEAHGLPWAA